MYNFEKQLYRNPDQDLNTLWWNMVKQYQFLQIPTGRNKADWAAKIHFSIAPCYYHNYLLGELLASQLHNYIVHNVLMLEKDRDVCYVNQKEVGDYLSKKVFSISSLLNWNDMINQATGEYLTAKYFVEQFIE